MSFLTPLFLLGGAAVLGPILFHLIRRTSKDKVSFSSLMFLQPSPPRVTKRSRIEHWLLLLLRCLVLLLLALAFARPFMVQPSDGSADSGDGGRRAIILVDASASMRRGDLWQEAQKSLEKTLGDLGGISEVAVMNFSRGTETLVSFEDWEQMDPAVRVDQVMQRSQATKAGWGGTSLDKALIEALDLLEEASVKDAESAAVKSRELYLISDLQEGASVKDLRAVQWPDEVKLSLIPVAHKAKSNAGIHSSLGQADELDQVRLLVVNAADSGKERFLVNWEDASGASVGEKKEIYVPPGQSRVVRLPAKGFESGGRVALAGDDVDFDNVTYHAPRPVVKRTVFVLNSGTADQKEMLYYLRRAYSASGDAPVEVLDFDRVDTTFAAALKDASLLFLLNGDPSVSAPVKEFLSNGRTAILVPTEGQSIDWIRDLMGESDLRLEAETSKRSWVLGGLDFQHPLLAPFADPRFSNFAGIQFWKRFKAEGLGMNVEVVASFDDDSPAWIEKRLEKGTLLLMASGWHPDQSQLAVTSKFVPLLYTLLDLSHPRQRMDRVVEIGDEVDLGLSMKENSSVTIRTPSGKEIQQSADEPFQETNEPGIYAIAVGNEIRNFAVNVPLEESWTSVMDTDVLELHGVQTSGADAEAVGEEMDEEEGRMLLKAQLESRQKLWRWAIAIALLLLLFETALAGKASKAATVEA